MDHICRQVIKVSGSGGRLILASLEENIIEYALHFEFLTINNEVEYDALTIGHKMAKELGVEHLKIYDDSNLSLAKLEINSKLRKKI